MTGDSRVGAVPLRDLFGQPLPIEERPIRAPGRWPWLRTHKGDRAGRALADRHYTRQTPGAASFTRPGNNLVYVTDDERAVWVTQRPDPRTEAKRMDGLDAWECTIFRNEGAHRSSTLIRLATALTYDDWGAPPSDGLITFVDPAKVGSEIPGYCFRRAGWKRVGESRDGKPMFRAPRPAEAA